jgi:hypothetical protein
MTMVRRGNESVNDQNTMSHASGDDTIELQLTADQVRQLSQAAAAAAAEAVAAAQISVAAPSRVVPVFSPPKPLFQVSPSSRSRRWHPTAIAKMAAATIAYAAFAWWSAARLAEPPQPPATAAVRPTAAFPPAASIASSPPPPVQVMNPFDPTEVFEFPAGTSPAESQDRMAQVLLQRARDRQGQWERNKPIVNLRTASLYPAP